MEDIKAYTISIFVTALLITVVDILAPTGNGGGLARHLRLVTSLALVCILISPTVALVEKLGELANGEWELGENSQTQEGYNEQMQNALDNASKEYFEEMLTQTLCEQFDITEGDIRTHVEWVGDTTDFRPQKVTVILSGKAIWKNPAKIEEYVSSLLGCDCASAIE